MKETKCSACNEHRAGTVLRQVAFDMPVNIFLEAKFTVRRWTNTDNLSFSEKDLIKFFRKDSLYIKIFLKNIGGENFILKN
ncbi:MAG: hypothetical protein QXF61_03265 [Nitrososphaeria archaeon]